MPSESLFIDPRDPALRSKVESIAKTPGICIFIDITGSTEMKSADLKEWIAKIHNCFANAATFLPNQFTPIKSIGDALMFYVEEPDLVASGYNILQVYDGLWQLATEPAAEFPDVKIGAAWCEDVYPITFFKGSRDYYGIDVDLTARLQSRAANRQVVIDSRFHQKLMKDFEGAGNRESFESVSRLVGPEIVADLKGVSREVSIYRGG